MLKKTIVYASAVIIIIIVLGYAAFNLAGKNAGNYVSDFQPDMSRIEDGVYEGEYHYLFHSLGARIRFEVKDNKLVSHEFEKLYGTVGYGAPESINMQINQRDDLHFEAVSGATVTSNLAKAAIKKALDNGPVE